MNGVERVALGALPAMILEGSTRRSRRVADDATPAPIMPIPLWAARLVLLYCVPMEPVRTILDGKPRSPRSSAGTRRPSPKPTITLSLSGIVPVDRLARGLREHCQRFDVEVIPAPRSF
jgi:hypothetical protein